MLLLLLQLAATAVVARPSLPHCSSTTVMQGHVADYDAYNREVRKFNAIQLTMVLKETACIELQLANDTTTSTLHTLEYLRLEQHHPIAGKYQFAIPYIRSRCFCDCAGGTESCKISDYNYQTCTEGTVCYRTFHGLQSDVGCEFTTRKSSVCCQHQLEPYRQWMFTALKISQPDTIFIMKYGIYNRIGNQWVKGSEETIEVPMNKGGAKFDLNRDNHIEITVSSGRPNRELAPGMYFIRDGTNEMREVDELNELKNADLGKLGWYRFIDGKWQVPKGPAKIMEKFHVDVQNCKEQRYNSTFVGRQVVIANGNGAEDIDEYDIGKPVTDFSWIKSAHVGDRAVRVEHGEGAAVTMHLTTESLITPRSHNSELVSFTGLIQMDQNSQSFLNITLFGAKGTLVGAVYSGEDKQHNEMAFSIQVDGTVAKDYYPMIVATSANIDGNRYVCLHPMGSPTGEQCKMFSYDAKSLPTFTVANRWHSGQGDRDKYNNDGFGSILDSVNPLNLFDGIDNVKEGLGLGINIVGIVCLAFVLLLCFTKCLYPLACCSLAVVRPVKK